MLTINSTVECGASPVHGGTVATSSSAKLTVNGKSVVMKSSVEGKSISGCQIKPKADSSGPTDKPCDSVSAVTLGESQKLTVGGHSVLRDDLAGTTNGLVTKVTPQTALRASANQSKLSAA